MIMDNQHKLIKGYRDLSQEEIDLINEIKGLGVQLEELILKLKCAQYSQKVDLKWVHVGEIDLQTGLMALTRAVARPTFF